MKRLISAKEIYSAKEKDEWIVIDKNTIVTPQAKDLAKELGVVISEEEKPQSQTQIKDCNNGNKNSICTEDKTAVLCEEEIHKILQAAVSKGIWTEEHIKALIDGLT